MGIHFTLDIVYRGKQGSGIMVQVCVTLWGRDALMKGIGIGVRKGDDNLGYDRRGYRKAESLWWPNRSKS